MASLLKEADEDTYGRKNPFGDEYRKAYKEFEEKYGSFGENLMTEEEREEKESGRGIRMYFPSDAEEYKPKRQSAVNPRLDGSSPDEESPIRGGGFSARFD